VTTKFQFTQEEEAYGRLLDDIWEMLSEPARALIEEAGLAAYCANMVHSALFHPEEYDEAMEKMRLAAAKLSNHECDLLAKHWRAALAAAASIDPGDKRPVGHKVYGRNLHWYYRMISGMVEKILKEIEMRRIAERDKEIAEREPEKFSDIPF
jgi:hypothetical protein